MKIRYLGTAAAEGWPAMYCNCDNCKRARAAGGKNIRTRSQSLINEDLLIDYPADTYSHVLQNNLDLSAVRYCFVTHSHRDHFTPSELLFHDSVCFAHDMKEREMELYGNEAVAGVYEQCLETYHGDPERLGIHLHLLEKYKTVEVGRYKITPLPAAHAFSENAFVFLIQEEDKVILYLMDTAVPKDEVFEWLSEHKVRADLITYDCTMGITPTCDVHMGIDMIPQVRKRLEELGVSDEHTISVLNHFSHNGVLTYDEMQPLAAEQGFLSAWDGMEIEV